jgi:hypothetical protein
LLLLSLLLLYHNNRRIGKVKFWALASIPIIFLSFQLYFYQSILGPISVRADPVMSLVVPVILLKVTSIISITLFAIGFRSISKALSHTPLIREYMMLTAYGIILFILATTTTTIVAAGFPPFGLVNVLLYGPFSFLVLIGLCRSANCVSEDAKLRRSINTLAKKESKLLDITSSAEVQREIQIKVMTTIKANAEMLEQQSGIEPSLSDEEIHEHLEIVTKEIRRQKMQDKNE